MRQLPVTPLRQLLEPVDAVLMDTVDAVSGVGLQVEAIWRAWPGCYPYPNSSLKKTAWTMIFGTPITECTLASDTQGTSVGAMGFPSLSQRDPLLQRIFSLNHNTNAGVVIFIPT